MKKTERGVFCIETQGDGDPSFEPFLRLLAKECDFSILGAAIRQVKTRNDVTKQIDSWSTKENANLKYPILWLTGHGHKGGFYVNDPKGAGHSRVDLRTLAEIASEHGGSAWSGCILHFSACSTLAAHDDDCRDLLENSGLQAISGYSKDVHWVTSLAFEMLYMRFLQDELTDRSSGSGILEDSVDQFRNRLLDSRMCSGLVDHLGFRIITRADVDLE